MFLARLLSGIVMVIAVAATIILGGNVTLAVVSAISMIGLFEIYRVFKIEKEPLGYVGFAFAVLYELLLYFGGNEYVMELLMAFLFCLMAVYVFTFPRYTANKVMEALFGLVYVVGTLSYLYLLRIHEDGACLLGLVFICAWGCDTCAYCVGMLIGKHKMAPILSPKKSIEGAVGGVIGAGILGVLYGTVLESMSVLHFPGSVAMTLGMICVIGAPISMVGDLCASAIKRNHEVKDYGNLIPGHGGIIDRFDSIMITAPIIYVLSLIFL